MPQKARVFGTWMYAAGAALPLVYGALWFIELYLYVIALFAGATLFFGAAIVRVGCLAIRRRWPCLDWPGALLLGAGVVVHVIAVLVLRTVNWC